MNNPALHNIAQQYGTPSYLFDLDEFTARIHMIQKVLGNQTQICYAMKANPFLTQAAGLASDRLEVCSPGEFAICQRAGISPKKIVLSGINKDPDDILTVMQNDSIGSYTAESENQLNMLEACAAKTGKTSIPVLLRITSGNQFGMDEDTIFSILSRREFYSHLDLKGLQYYSGTQKQKIGSIIKELQYLDNLCSRFQADCNFRVRELEYGPGFYIPYFEKVSAAAESVLLSDFKQAVETLSFHGTLILELGRFLAAPCGSYLTKIADTKCNRGQHYCIIDGGIHHINYYGQAMAMKIPPYRFLPKKRLDSMTAASIDSGSENAVCSATEHTADSSKWTICGSLCTAGDVIVKNLPLINPQKDDLLIFDQIGAYSVTEGIYLFLSRKLPRIITYSSQIGTQVVREAIPTDLFNFAAENPEQLPLIFQITETACEK